MLNWLSRTINFSVCKIRTENAFNASRRFILRRDCISRIFVLAGNGVQRWLQQVHAVLNGSLVAKPSKLYSAEHDQTQSPPSFLPSSRSPMRRRALDPRMLIRRFYSTSFATRDHREDTDARNRLKIGMESCQLAKHRLMSNFQIVSSKVYRAAIETSEKNRSANAVAASRSAHRSVESCSAGSRL